MMFVTLSCYTNGFTIGAGTKRSGALEFTPVLFSFFFIVGFVLLIR